MIKIQIKWTLPEDGEKDPHHIGQWLYDKKYYNEVIKDMRSLGPRRKDPANKYHWLVTKTAPWTERYRLLIRNK